MHTRGTKIEVRYGDLAGRRALVAGASSGIGLGIAEALLDQGMRVAVHYRSSRAAAETLCAKFPDAAVPVQADLGTEDGCVRAIRNSVEALGGLEQLVHGAGIWNEGPIATLTLARIEEIFRINVFSALLLVREALPHLLRDPKRRGNVILIGSTAGQRGEAEHAHYAGTKGAIQSIAMSLAVELAPRIRVNLISPGWVRTPMTESDLRAIEPELAACLPNRRVGEVEDCAHAALYLASEASAHLIGQDLCVSGGALHVLPRGQFRRQA
jgi:3-oxoacyl-[acyl-carrier protein] reductase